MTVKQDKDTNLLRRFAENKDGQFGVVFAVLALPVMLLTTLVIDHRMAAGERTKLNNALDNAALAAVMNQTITPGEREIFSEKYFYSTLTARNQAKFKALDSSNQRVELTASAKVPTLMGAIAGVDHFDISETVVAELTKGQVVCMLALDPVSKNSFEVANGAKFNAETCAVQVNSTHKSASVVGHNATAVAKSFCVVGGATGTYDPFVNSDCSTIVDPYQHVRIPGPGDCIVQPEFDKMSRERTDVAIELMPGTYCGGLDLAKKNVVFSPGEYVITGGPLSFANSTTAKGEGVTFILSGADATLQVASGSNLKFSAPTHGELAGLVFAQHLVKGHGKAARFPDGESVIRSGGVEIVGTVYLPTQRISFLGGSLTETQAPATSFIGYQISVTRGADISVAVDHEIAGLPPILPRSDEGARLSR